MAYQFGDYHGRENRGSGGERFSHSNPIGTLLASKKRDD